MQKTLSLTQRLRFWESAKTMNYCPGHVKCEAIHSHFWLTAMHYWEMCHLDWHFTTLCSHLGGCLHRKAMTGSERNYQNLERECLAMIWGYYFLYGNECTLEMDQKPLVSTYKTHMFEISPRIKRLVVRSFPYQPFKVQYRKGVEIPLAGALSWITPLPMEEDGIQLQIIAVNLVTANIPFSSNVLDNIC